MVFRAWMWGNQEGVELLPTLWNHNGQAMSLDWTNLCLIYVHTINFQMWIAVAMIMKTAIHLKVLSLQSLLLCIFSINGSYSVGIN